MSEFFETLMGAVLFVVIILSIIFFGTNYYEEYRCNSYKETTGMETKWKFLDDCYIETKNGWLTKEEYKLSIATKGELK